MLKKTPSKFYRLLGCADVDAEGKAIADKIAAKKAREESKTTNSARKNAR